MHHSIEFWSTQYLYQTSCIVRQEKEHKKKLIVLTKSRHDFVVRKNNKNKII